MALSMRFLTALRCLVGLHPWPAAPTAKTFLHEVYVCPACLATKQVLL